jgi:hypothetical protein
MSKMGSQVSGWGWKPAQPSGTAWHMSVLSLGYMLLKGLPDVSGRKLCGQGMGVHKGGKCVCVCIHSSLLMVFPLKKKRT